jgi:hypothetical protein
MLCNRMMTGCIFIECIIKKITLHLPTQSLITPDGLDTCTPGGATSRHSRRSVRVVRPGSWELRPYQPRTLYFDNHPFSSVLF